MRGCWAWIPAPSVTISFHLGQVTWLPPTCFFLCRVGVVTVLTSQGCLQRFQREGTEHGIKVRFLGTPPVYCDQLGTEPFSVASRCHCHLRRLMKAQPRGSPNLLFFSHLTDKCSVARTDFCFSGLTSSPPVTSRLGTKHIFTPSISSAGVNATCFIRRCWAISDGDLLGVYSWPPPRPPPFPPPDGLQRSACPKPNLSFWTLSSCSSVWWDPPVRQKHMAFYLCWAHLFSTCGWNALELQLLEKISYMVGKRITCFIRKLFFHFPWYSLPCVSPFLPQQPLGQMEIILPTWWMNKLSPRDSSWHWAQNLIRLWYHQTWPSRNRQGHNSKTRLNEAELPND